MTTSEDNFILHISASSWELKSYLSNFMQYVYYTDITLYKVLALLTGYKDSSGLGSLS